MKKCLNCDFTVREDDIYCRNCGCVLQTSKGHVFTNIITVLLVIGIIFMILLFIASYLV